jgi:tetratricopeptide (TPR) repeat protein
VAAVRAGRAAAAAFGAAAACAALLAVAAPDSPEIEKRQAAVARQPGDAAAHFDLAAALALAGRKEEALVHFERAIDLAPGNLRYGNDYRRACVGAGEYQRAIDFLEKEVEAHADVMALRLNLALAYVDKMPYPGYGIVSQGLLSNRSIRELNVVLERDPGSWAAMYGRAMNHLHWPRALMHSSQAIDDFQACLRMQSAVPAAKLRLHNLLPYLGLGDAQVKNGRLDAARRTWKEAQKLFPGDPRLTKRLSLGDDDLRKFVEEERGLARPIDTDLSFVWNP